jgi:hypothetical protein
MSSAADGLETLLDLDGSIFEQDGGYWVKIEAWRAMRIFFPFSLGSVEFN